MTEAKSVNRDNIDELIYKFACMLEKLVEIKKEFDDYDDLIECYSNDGSVYEDSDNESLESLIEPN
jgi:hypothetical protein